MEKQDDGKRDDQIRLLEICREFTDTKEWNGTFTYPNCGHDLLSQGLVTEDKKITTPGRAALWLLGKGPDVTESKSYVEFSLDLNRNEE